MAVFITSSGSLTNPEGYVRMREKSAWKRDKEEATHAAPCVCSLLDPFLRAVFPKIYDLAASQIPDSIFWVLTPKT